MRQSWQALRSSCTASPWPEHLEAEVAAQAEAGPQQQRLQGWTRPPTVAQTLEDWC